MKFENLLICAMVAVLLVAVFMLERAKWQECRRYHPTWYCFETAGGK